MKPAGALCAIATLPGRGKSQAIEHNRALPKAGQSLRRASLGGLPLRALRVRVMVGYVLRPSPDKSYSGAAIAALGYSGAARWVVWVASAPEGALAGRRCRWSDGGKSRRWRDGEQKRTASKNAGRNAGRIERRNSVITRYALGDKAFKKYLRM